MIIENELKLALPAAKIGVLRRHPVLKSFKTARAVKKRLLSTYFDTPDHRLFRQALSIRVRRIGERRLQTLKAGNGAVAGLSTRNEWETEVADDRPDPTRLRELGATPAVAGLDGDAELVPVFETDVTRTAWPLRLEDGSEVELAIDVGEIRAGERRLPICEAELELKSGEPAKLFDLAARLLDTVPFRIENRSKHGRGYALLTGAAPTAVKGIPVELEPGTTVEAAFKAIARACIAQLEANEACALAGDDPEGIHQMRVALRRLRSAVNLFRDALPVEAQARFGEQLRAIAQRLGHARDWDVFALQTVAALRRRLPDDASLRALAAAAEEHRQSANAAAHELLLSPAYTEAKLALGRWLAERDWAQQCDVPRAATLTRPAHDFANAVLERRARKLRKLGKRHAELGPAELHRLRIRAKKLRYAADFFRSLYSRKAVRQHATALGDMQDALGAINDTAVGQALLAELADNSGAGKEWMPRAGALVEGWFAALVEAHLGQFAAVWDGYAGLKPFWQRPPATAE